MTKEELANRTFEFALRCAKLVQALPKGDVAAREYGRQLLRSSASVAANYRAANRGRSRPEFIAKLGIVEEEADECIFWIDMLAAINLVKANRVADLKTEANEILAIIIASIKTARRNTIRS